MTPSTDGSEMRRRALLPLALLAAVLAPGCGRGPAGETPVFEDAPIILISIDTLRSDRLPVYGYREVETPAISRLAREGLVFEHAYSHVPLTLPAHVSMLTGLLPGEHGVRDNLGYRLDAAAHPSLPRLLKSAGYATGAAVSAYVMRAETGVAAGFDFFEGAIDLRMHTTLGGSQRPCGETLAAARPWLREVADRPFFFFYHLYEPHTPYEAPADLRRRYTDPYDAEIAAADRCVGDLFAELEELGLYEEALVVLVSDHGEGLGDHGEPEHGILLYREALEVPLLVKLPDGGRAGERVAAPAQLIDLLPTLAAVSDVAAPDELDGRSLLAPASPQEAPRPIFAETYYPRLHMGWSELRSVIQYPHQLIVGPDPELYDLEQDPAQRHDLVERQRRLAGRLNRHVTEMSSPLEAPAAEDAETERRLAALGYLGTAAVTAEGPLPDPKTRLHVLRDYGAGLAALTGRRFGEAVTLFEELTAENPYMVDAWEQLGVALQRLGRRQEALAAYREAMELSGGSSHVALSTASVLLELERFDEAAQHARMALATSPAPAHSMLASIAVEQEDLAAAEREARAALEAGGSRIGPLVTLAQVQVAAERLEEALATTEEARAELAQRRDTESFPGLEFVRGDALARLGRAGEAERAFLAEIRAAPNDPKAYTRLAALYAAAGQPEAASEILRMLIQRNRDAPGAWAEAVRTLRILGDTRGAERLLQQARTRFPDDPGLIAMGS